MKLGKNKVTKIDFANVIGTTISCVITILLSRQSSPHPDNLDNDNAPDVTQISDDSSVEPYLFSRDSESEGGIRKTPKTMMSLLNFLTSTYVCMYGSHIGDS